MRNDEFDAKCRAFENSNDPRIHPGMQVVVRIDGKNFSTLTRKTLKLDPFDEGMRDAMRGTLEFIMQQDFKCLFGYTHSDEMSILLDPYTTTFGGKIRKILSIMAAQASVHFSSLIKHPCYFDARVIQMPTIEDVCDYFVWRNQDSERNCLNMWAYHLLLKDGLNPTQAQRVLDGKEYNFKQDVLWTHGKNFNDLPSWQKRGIGMKWQKIDTSGWNPKEEVFIPIVKKKLQTYQIPQFNEDLRKNIRDIIEERVKEYKERKK